MPSPLVSTVAVETLPFVRREYIRHQVKHLAYLTANYQHYTIDELELQLGVPAHKLKALARRNGIRKRAANKQPHPKKEKTLITAASLLPV